MRTCPEHLPVNNYKRGLDTHKNSRIPTKIFIVRTFCYRIQFLLLHYMLQNPRRRRAGQPRAHLRWSWWRGTGGDELTLESEPWESRTLRKGRLTRHKTRPVTWWFGGSVGRARVGFERTRYKAHCRTIYAAGFQFTDAAVFRCNTSLVEERRASRPSPVHLPSTGRLENTQEAEEEGGGSSNNARPT